MSRDRERSEEFERLLEEFSYSIRRSLEKFGLERRGIDPEDVLQEIRLRLWKKFASEKKIRSRASYISVVVNSVLTDCLRRARRTEKVLQHEKEKCLQSAEQPAGCFFSDERTWRIVAEAIDSLIESRRVVVKMYFLNANLEEIAASLGWSLDKTRNLLYRGLSDIRLKLKERGIEYEDLP